ncbi:MAG: hypothetical protein KME52_07500 [Desmonostoc geniculatum HA4340-LM1]|jgi:hypothetical protein|nr:hypothetical protein [Desmonostoc geniculatum HA4340-LM1]
MSEIAIHLLPRMLFDQSEINTVRLRQETRVNRRQDKGMIIVLTAIYRVFGI